MPNDTAPKQTASAQGRDRVSAARHSVIIPLVDMQEDRQVYHPSLLYYGLLGALLGGLSLGWLGLALATASLPVAGLGQWAASGLGPAAFAGAGMGIAGGGLIGALIALYRLPSRSSGWSGPNSRSGLKRVHREDRTIKRGSVMKIIIAIGIVILLLAGLALAFIYSGVYNIAATNPHSGLERWVLHTTMHHSVRRHANGIIAPALTEPAQIEAGFRHFRTMCVTCHGAPGAKRSELGQGLTPQAPNLAEKVHEWTPGELFWIVKHGIKMTGMPAWGLTHSDDDLWAVVAFLRELPELSPEDYQALEQAARANAHKTGRSGHPH